MLKKIGFILLIALAGGLVLGCGDYEPPPYSLPFSNLAAAVTAGAISTKGGSTEFNAATGVVSGRGTSEHDHNDGIFIDLDGLKKSGWSGTMTITVTNTGSDTPQIQGIAGRSFSGGSTTISSTDSFTLPWGSYDGERKPFICTTSTGMNGNFTIAFSGDTPW